MRIMLPVDGSPASMAAVRHALSLVESGLAAEMVLVNVQVPPSLYEVVTAQDAEVIEHVRSDAGADLLAPAEALLSSAGLTWESEVAGGHPHTLLLELMENYGCQLVVMGARGMGDRDASGLGSVALSVLAGSPVPVTVVHAPAVDTASGVDSQDGEYEGEGDRAA